jgi:hypothetical protein
MSSNNLIDNLSSSSNNKTRGYSSCNSHLKDRTTSNSSSSNEVRIKIARGEFWTKITVLRLTLKMRTTKISSMRPSFSLYSNRNRMKKRRRCLEK